MKRRRKIMLAVGLLTVLLVGVVIVVVVGPSHPRFVCHRMLDGILEQWKQETASGELLPNVSGSSSQSLSLLLPWIGRKGDENPLCDYRYVAGLRSDDPKEMILFYLCKPSRKTWHGDTHWFRQPKRWVVVSLDWGASCDSRSDRNGGELCEALEPAEFKNRLRTALAYLKQHNRPGWQAAEREHLEFLNSMERNQE